MTDRITCSRCTMSFRVQKMRQRITNRQRCPDCKRPFWDERSDKYGSVVIVGIDPKWLEEWNGEDIG